MTAVRAEQDTNVHRADPASVDSGGEFRDLLLGRIRF